jgi:hypothetical protein
MPQHHLTAWENKHDYRVKQGSRFTMLIKVPGDKTTGYGLKAQIRRKPGEPTTLAIFNVTAPVYDAGTDLTTWELYLTASQTDSTPQTRRNRPSDVIIGTHVWCWDALLEDLSDSDNNLRLIDVSYVEVVPGVSE